MGLSVAHPQRAPCKVHGVGKSLLLDGQGWTCPGGHRIFAREANKASSGN